MAPSLRFTGAQVPASAPVSFGASGAAAKAPGLLFAPWLIKLFHQLDQRNSMFAVAIRDAVDSTGRIVAEFQRHPLSGWESLTEEGITSVVWGWGIPKGKDVYDQWMAGRVQKGKSNVWFPKLDVELLPTPTETSGIQRVLQGLPLLGRMFRSETGQWAQKLTPEQVRQYYWVDESLKQTHPEEYAKQVARKAHLEQLLRPAGERLREAYRWNKLTQLLVCSFVPIVVLAVGIPALNQYRTREYLRRERRQAQKRGATPTQPATATNAAATAIPHRANNAFSAFQAPGAAGLTAAGKSPAPAFAGRHPQDVRFSGVASDLNKALSPFVNFLLDHEVLNTVLFVDLPLSTGRVVMAARRNAQDMWEKLIKEVVLVATVFWGQRLIQDHINGTLDKVTGTRSGLEFKTLSDLVRQYGQKPEQLKADVAQAMAQLGQKPGQWDAPALADQVRAYIQTKYQRPEAHQPNLLLDLAEQCDKIPVLKTLDPATGKRIPRTIDITQRIRLEDITLLGDQLHGVLEQVGQRGASLEQLLAKTTASKYAAFTLSSAVCWGIVSWMLPKIQHYATYLQTGQPNLFPGVIDSDTQAAA